MTSARRPRRWPWVLLALPALLLAAFLALRTPDIPAAELRAQHANAESEFVAVAPGLAVHLRDQGPPDAPAIVLLHGSNASLHTWEPWVERLSERFRVVTLDLPGHGLTGPSPTDDYSVAGFVRAVDAVARERGLDRFVLGGNSMGGWVAWNYALAHPEKLRGLLLVNAAGAPLPAGARPSPPVGFRIARTPGLSRLMEQVTPRAMVERSLRHSVSNAAVATPAAVDRYWELLRHPGNRRATVLRFATPREPATEATLGRIAAPTLVLWGREDRLIPVEAAAVFDRAIPNSRAVIYDRIGHLPMEEAPDASAADVRTFLDSLAP